VQITFGLLRTTYRICKQCNKSFISVERLQKQIASKSGRTVSIFPVFDIRTHRRKCCGFWKMLSREQQVTRNRRHFCVGSRNPQCRKTGAPRLVPGVKILYEIEVWRSPSRDFGEDFVFTTSCCVIRLERCAVVSYYGTQMRIAAGFPALCA